MPIAVELAISTGVRPLRLALAVAALAAAASCKSEGPPPGPPVPASADPEGRDLEPGAVVVAAESTGQFRIYKVLEVRWLPEPAGEELLMVAYQQTGESFEEAARLWATGQLAVAIGKVRVPKHRFLGRDHRVIAREPVTDHDLGARRDDPQKPASP